MFTVDRQRMLDAVGSMGAMACAYFYRPFDKVENAAMIAGWLETRCDCKYGYSVEREKSRGGVGEQTGCPELRSIYAVLEKMSEAEWNALTNEAGAFDLMAVLYPNPVGLRRRAREIDGRIGSYETPTERAFWRGYAQACDDNAEEVEKIRKGETVWRSDDAERERRERSRRVPGG